MKNRFLMITIMLVFVIGSLFTVTGALGQVVLGVSDNDRLRDSEPGWIERSPFSEPPNYEPGIAMAYDSGRDVTVLYIPQNPGQTWEWDGTNWTQCFPDDNPGWITGGGMVYDSARDVSVFYGGGETWYWDGMNWVQRVPEENPGNRYQHAMAFDSARGVTVLFGGSNSTDTWEWDGTNWTQYTPTNQPPARDYHAMVYDSIREMTVLFGGYGAGDTYFNDTWEWDGTDWQQRTPVNSPAGREYHAMAYDSGYGVTILYGGYGENFSTLDDTWVWDGINWIQLAPTNNPGKTARHTMAYDSARGVTVLFDGSTWEYGGEASPDPTPGPTPSPTLDPTAPRHIYLPLILQGLPTTLTPPDAPILNEINNDDGDGNYAVSWSVSASAKNYTLQEATDLNFTNASTVYTGANTLTDISGRDVGTYYYRVRAANASGQSDWSNMQSVVVTVPFIPKEWDIFNLPGVGFSTSLALSSGGIPHIGLSLDKYIYYMHWDGDKWASETIDTLTISSAGLDINASLAIGQTGQPQIAYAFYNPAQIGYASWDGTMWKKSYLTGMIPYHVNLALKADDDPCISYLNYGLGGDWSIYFNCRTGSSWGMSRFVDNVTWGVRKPNSQSHSLALTTDGTPHISYYRGRNDSEARLYHATLIGGSWEKTAVDGQGTGSFSSLALDSQSYPHISYHNHENGTLKYARWNGSQWQVETVDSTGIVDQYMGQLTSLALDKNDHPHISYIDVTNRYLKYAYWDGSQWNIEIIDDSGLLWRWISLALDDSGFAHISYVTLDGNKIGLMYATNSGFSGE